MVYIIVVNWNGWQDTIECLESVFRLNYPAYRVIVCDNHSTDGSLDYIRAWAAGEINVRATGGPLTHLAFPPVPKPISCTSLDAAAATEQMPAGSRSFLLLMQSGKNLGFAGANNVGLRYALRQQDMRYAWLLNNDTVVDPDSLVSAVDRLSRTPGAGMCGSTLLYYDKPEIVQALGGSLYNRWVARGKHLGALGPATPIPDAATVEEKMDYVVGASMIVSRAFLETVGLMNEEYFLFFEEIDWATRARGRFSLAYCPESIVYHRVGASIGTNVRSALSDYYATRNRIRFTRRYYPYALCTVYPAVFASALHRAYHEKWSNLSAVIRAALGANFRRSR